MFAPADHVFSHNPVHMKRVSGGVRGNSRLF